MLELFERDGIPIDLSFSVNSDGIIIKFTFAGKVEKLCFDKYGKAVKK